MTPKRRQSVLLVLLAASAAAVAYDRMRSRSPAVNGAVVRPSARSPALAAPGGVAAARGALPSSVAGLRTRTDFVAGDGDAFTVTWPVVASAPPPPPAPPPVPVAPTAPALPFTVIGKKFERGAWEVYLAKGDATYIATPGALIADDYRIKDIAPTTMTMIYLPLNETQTMQTGASLHE